MLLRRVRSLMAVSSPIPLAQSKILIRELDGYGHLILRVEFAKRAT